MRLFSLASKIAFVFLLGFFTVMANANDEICVSGESGIRIVQELERAEKLKELTVLQAEAIKSLEKRIELQTEIIGNDERIMKMKDAQLAAQQQAIENYQKLVDLQTKAIKEVESLVKPSMFEQMKTLSVGAIIGAIILGVLIAL